METIGRTSTEDFAKGEEYNMSRCPISFVSRIFGVKRKQAERACWLEEADSKQVSIEVEDRTILQQLEMIDLSLEEIKIAKAIQPFISEHINEIVSTFYQKITNIEQLKAIIIEHSTIEKLRQTLEAHLIEMFSGQIDEHFLNKRIKVANVHYRIGLEPKWYMGAFQNLRAILLQLVHQHIDDRETSIKISQVISKILNFEQQLVLEAYEKENVRQRQLQYDKVKKELKAKIITVCEDMTGIAEQTNAAVQQLVAGSEAVNSSVLVGADKTRDTQKMATKGQEQLLGLESQIASIFTRTSRVEEIVAELNDSVQEIGKVISLVQTIADQTNLLALNSSIEAARAGEHGKGFSVVAEEIRKLATQTKDSVNQIRDNVIQTTDFTEEVVVSIHEVHQFVQEGKVESEATDLAFQKIVEAMSKSLQDVENVEQGMETLVYNIREISRSMDKVVASADTLLDAAENL